MIGREDEIRVQREAISFYQLAVLIALAFIFLRLFYLQVLKGEELKKFSEANRLKKERKFSTRGILYDRTGKIIVDNRASYDIVLFSQYYPFTDEVNERLAKGLGMPLPELEKKIAKVSKSPSFYPILLKSDVSKDVIAAIEMDIHGIPGIDIESNVQRRYPHGELAAQILGYTGEVDTKDIKSDATKQLQLGDYIGKMGIENGKITSMIFWGPPASGKTTLANIISKTIKADFIKISAVIDGKERLKEVLDTAKINREKGILTILFIDEIHRWSKAQQDALLSGLNIPTSGEILVNGIDIKKYDRDYIYTNIGLVFQENIIFNSTIKENITFGEEYEFSELEKAVNTAKVNDFLELMDDGMKTVISERGSDLSGGQKQRLSLARALVRNPKLLLLDDFTARVDMATEKEILDLLEKNYPEITVCLITQKLSTAKHYDIIYLVMNGELVDSGKHEELLERCFEYRQIYESQNLHI
jgi:ABC-type multidrug transport system ATPase subunit